jgi:hypothetical protein
VRDFLFSALEKWPQNSAKSKTVRWPAKKVRWATKTVRWPKSAENVGYRRTHAKRTAHLSHVPPRPGLTLPLQRAWQQNSWAQPRRAF